MTRQVHTLVQQVSLLLSFCRVATTRLSLLSLRQSVKCQRGRFRVSLTGDTAAGDDSDGVGDISASTVCWSINTRRRHWRRLNSVFASFSPKSAPHSRSPRPPAGPSCHRFFSATPPSEPRCAPPFGGDIAEQDVGWRLSLGRKNTAHSTVALRWIQMCSWVVTDDLNRASRKAGAFSIHQD